MADVDIELTLQGGEVSGGRRRYEPGSAVHGWLRLTPREDVNCRRLLARAEWHTEGRGDRDGDCVAEVELAEGDLSAGTPVIQEFSLTLPSEPWSYAGHYINVIWEVIVVVDTPFARDVIRKRPIVVAPARVR
jgi:hypothetical protein